MEISFPSEGDVDAIVELAAKGFKESSLGDMEPDEETIRKTVLFAVASPNAYIRVLKSPSGEVVGVISGVITPSLNMKGDVVTDVINYVDKRYRGKGKRLLDGLIEWAFGFRSVRYVALNVSFVGIEGERSGKWYESRGASPAGASFVIRRSV